MTRAELLDRLDVLLGGRVAEEMIFGDVSTGAQDDLQRATDLARHMVTRYGMSDGAGAGDVRAPRPALFLRCPRHRPNGVQRAIPPEMIDAEMRRLLEAAHLRVQATLTEKRRRSRCWRRG